MAKLSSRQIAEWEAYASLETMGEDREDIRCAMLLSQIYNRHRGKNEPYQSPKHYLDILQALPQRELTPEEETKRQLNILRPILRKSK